MFVHDRHPDPRDRPRPGYRANLTLGDVIDTIGQREDLGKLWSKVRGRSMLKDETYIGRDFFKPTFAAGGFRAWYGVWLLRLATQ